MKTETLTNNNMKPESQAETEATSKKPRIPKPIKYFVLGWGTVIALLAVVAYIADIMNQ